jgi:hypothetical protein
MIAVEIYPTAADVPKEYQQYSWGGAGRQTTMYSRQGSSSSDHCSLVVYWTRFT